MKAKRVKGLDPQGSLTPNATRIVSRRLDEMRSFAEQALVPDAVKDQHDMRIAAKRLRYVLEVVEPCFGNEAVTARKRARDLQGILGDIHDCDVMLPRVEEQIERLRAEDSRSILLRAGEADDLEPRLAARAPNRSGYRGLEILAVHLSARRALLFERFREAWQAEAGKGTWASLETALERAAAQG